MEIQRIYELAIQASMGASEAILKIYLEDFNATLKPDGSPATEADMASSQIINEILLETNIPCTSEETEKTPYEDRKKWTLLWCVDPLDGTKEFIKKNNQFAINIALIENSKPIFGLIADPISKRIILGDKTMGVYLFNFDQAQQPEAWEKVNTTEYGSSITVTCSNSHQSDKDLAFIETLSQFNPNLHFIKRGSALKFFDLATGAAHIYPRFAPTMEWDTAAGQAILEALGGSLVDAYTLKPLQYNKENLLNPHFIAKAASVNSFL